MKLVHPSAVRLHRHVRWISSSFKAHLHELNASGQTGRVVFGTNVAATQLGALSRACGMSKVLLVRDPGAGAASRTRFAEFLLMQAGVPCFQYTLKRDCATFEGVDDAIATAQRVGANGIVAFGGGNTMDMARAVALVLANGGTAMDFVDGTKRLKFEQGKRNTVPLLLVPTIAGSGAEGANRSVLLDEDAATKLLFVPDTHIVPEAVLLDPTLMLTVPLDRTVQGALTSLGQCLESSLMGRATDATHKVAIEGLEAVAGAFARPLSNGTFDVHSAALRGKLALGSFASGVAASALGTGATQALAIAVESMFDVPYVQGATAFLPLVFDRYAELSRENDGHACSDALHTKLAFAVNRLASSSGCRGATVAAWLRSVMHRFALPTVATLELDEKVVKDLVDRAVQYQEESIESSPSGRTSGAWLERDDYRAIVDAAVAASGGQ